MNYTQALSNEQLQRYVPSAFAVAPYAGMSSRYAFVPTSAVIEGMRGAGFLPVSASQSRTRIADKKDYTKHMIRFRAARSLQSLAVVGGQVLETVLINGHDGSTRYKLMCGVFKFICSNGMVVADSLIESVNIRHTGNIIEDVISSTERILANGPRVMDTIDQWQTLTLSQPEQRLLAEHAHSLRFPLEEQEDGSLKPNPTDVTPEILLSARRSDDNKPDLWNTFNRIQENSIKGVRTWARNEYGRSQRVTSRAVKGIDGDVKLNRALWSLAEKFAELKRAA